VLAVVLSSVAVYLFGETGGDNFRFKVAGVFTGLLLTIALVRYNFWSQAWMAPAVYGWLLKRTLMNFTTVMHHVPDGVAV
ncbi:DUF3087 family protein, partial [Pseudomonas sp. CCC3.2]|uniref:DUF3087 family protein n=1 Tax=Pseudomonas sp. CCC3.2 TaxID=3048608 RepID=UPI002B23D6F0